jgi:glycosyl transferase family 4
VKRVLVVSPHFPPTNAADMHRVRIAVPHFREFGWEPYVLAVDAGRVPGSRDPLLEATVPADIPVRRTGAFSQTWTRRIGLGSLGIRAWAHLFAAGSDIIRRHAIDIVYFSTTQFLVLPLGRIWKRRHGVPFVADIQDMWSPGPETTPSHAGGKHDVMRRIHAALEPWTLAAADGIVAVSPDYIATLRARYPQLAERPLDVLPFGAAEADFEIVARRPQPNRVFHRADGDLHGVYVGRGGADMTPAFRTLFRAFAAGLRDRPDLFPRVRLHFVGTSYAADGRATKTVEPLAADAGVGRHVREHVERIPYFEALQVLRDAHFLIVPGSSDATYSPSKVFPYVLAGRPLVGVVAKGSPALEILRRLGRTDVIEFDGTGGGPTEVAALQQVWTSLLARLDADASDMPLDRAAFEPFSAREMARAQCALLDRALIGYRQRTVAAAAAAARAQ